MALLHRSPMACAEWQRLLDRYCPIVHTYSEAVLELRSADDTDAGDARAHAEQLRMHAQQARLDWEQHERTHGCLRKPAAKERKYEDTAKETGA